jgi:hypothetical protein
MPERSYIFDTVSLGNFLLAEATEIISHRYGGRAYITNEVIDELMAGMRIHPALTGINGLIEKKQIDIVVMSAAERRHYASLIANLGRGEASCIAVARARRWTVISDDRACRNHCAEMHVPVTGTIGILKAACIDHSLAPHEADRILDAMIAAGFFSPVQRISALL